MVGFLGELATRRLVGREAAHAGGTLGDDRGVQGGERAHEEPGHVEAGPQLEDTRRDLRHDRRARA